MIHRPIQQRVPARVGLLGNPSDGFGGRTLSFAIEDFSALVRLESEPAPPGPAAVLLQAAWRRLRSTTVGTAAERLDDPTLPDRLTVQTSIPRQVGLSGSSAIVIGALRCLSEYAEHGQSPDALAALALEVESEELGIQAGPMDRLVQCHRGLLLADHGAETHQHIDPALLPSLYLAWSRVRGTPSGVLHRDAATRWREGDAEMRSVIDDLSELPVRGVRALEQGDARAFAALVDRNFALRCRVWPIDAASRSMVALGRSMGCAAKLAGSGGAVVGVLPDPAAWAAVSAAHQRSGYGVCRPTLASPEPPCAPPS